MKLFVPLFYLKYILAFAMFLLTISLFFPPSLNTSFLFPVLAGPSCPSLVLLVCKPKITSEMAHQLHCVACVGIISGLRALPWSDFGTGILSDITLS